MPLTKIKHFLVPHEMVFFDKLSRQAETMHAGTNAFAELLRDYCDVEAKAKGIKGIEHEGDELLHDIYSELNRSFIVPLDHSDISALASALDDILDLATASAKYLAVYEIREPPGELVALASVLNLQAAQLKTAVCSLRSPKTFATASGCCVEINRLENEADELHTRAIAALFKQKDAIEIMKLKEILNSVEAATDKAERAANVISDIVMKHS